MLKSFIILLVISTGQHPSEPTVSSSDFDWVVGQWDGKFGDAKITETWVKQSDELFTASGFVIAGTDTVVKENLRIEKIGHHWTFISVINQNHPVLFTLINSNNQVFTFENKEHDFPQRIVYSKTKDGDLLAWIEGEMGQKASKEEYRYSRVE